MSGSIVSFDYFDLPETPDFILCNPNMEQLYSLGQISERKYSARYNTMSELSFRADEYIDGALVEYYPFLTYRRLVYAEALGYFMITEVNENGDGVTKYKEIKCKSIENALTTKNVTKFKGTYKFYDESLSGSSLMEVVLKDYAPDWTLEIQDWSSGSLIDRYRTFDVSDSTLYNFLTTEVSQAYECIFLFDNKTKKITAVEVGLPGTGTEIYISYDNVVESMQVSEVTDNLATAVIVLGGNGLDINDVNPLGNNYIYNFSYFKNTDWMSASLVDYITAWENLVAGSTAEYFGYVTDLGTWIEAQTDYNADMQVTSACIAALNTELAAAIEGGLTSEIERLQADIVVKNAELATITANYNIATEHVVEISGSMRALSEGLSFEANFPTSPQNLYAELQPFIIESTYVNENFQVLNSMSSSSIQQESLLLYDQGVKALQRISQPRYTFEIDAVNMLMIKDFQTFADELELGCLITIERVGSSGSSPPQTLTAILLGYDINFDDPSDFKMIFGNRKHLDDPAFEYSDMMAEAFKAIRRTQVNSLTWNAYSGSDVTVQLIEFTQSPINLVTNQVISGSYREITIDPSGFTGRLYNTGGEYYPNQLRINNSIVFTDNNWTSSSTALGNFWLGTTDGIPDQAKILSGSGVGLVANTLVGHLVADDKLVIANEDGNVVISASCVYLTVVRGRSTISINPEVGLYIYDTTAGHPVFAINPTTGSISINGA